MAMAQSVPDWMMLDRFVYRRDDEGAFPDEARAPLRASSCTSLGQKFQVAFIPANPPAISRFYVRWPGGTKPEEGNGNELVAAHQDLILFRITSMEKLEESPYLRYTQDHFVCVALSNPEPHLQLKRLPLCSKTMSIPPNMDEEEETVLPRVFFPNTVGLTREVRSGGGEDVFVVAQLGKVSPRPSERRKMEADVCVLRSRLSSDDGHGNWEVEKIKIVHKDEEYTDLWYWSTDDVVMFLNCIFWVDYHRGGVLVYDPVKEEPTILYHRLKISNRPTSLTHRQVPPEMNRSMCVTTTLYKEVFEGNPVLRFVDVARLDDCLFGPFELGSGFTINLSTKYSMEMPWLESARVTSTDLWAANDSSGLPHEMLMFPLVNMQRSNIVHCLVSHYVEQDDEETRKVSMVTLDMNTKKLVSIDPYITVGEGGEDADMVKEKSHLLKGFIASKFPSFLKRDQSGYREALEAAAMMMMSRASGSGSVSGSGSGSGVARPSGGQ